MRQCVKKPRQRLCSWGAQNVGAVLPEGCALLSQDLVTAVPLTQPGFRPGLAVYPNQRTLGIRLRSHHEGRTRDRPGETDTQKAKNTSRSVLKPTSPSLTGPATHPPCRRPCSARAPRATERPSGLYRCDTRAGARAPRNDKPRRTHAVSTFPEWPRTEAGTSASGLRNPWEIVEPANRPAPYAHQRPGHWGPPQRLRLGSARLGPTWAPWQEGAQDSVWDRRGTATQAGGSARLHPREQQVRTLGNKH